MANSLATASLLVLRILQFLFLFQYLIYFSSINLFRWRYFLPGISSVVVDGKKQQYSGCNNRARTRISAHLSSSVIYLWISYKLLKRCKLPPSIVCERRQALTSPPPHKQNSLSHKLSSWLCHTKGYGKGIVRYSGKISSTKEFRCSMSL